MSTKAKIEYTVQVWQEGKQFVAHAMPLDVMSCGSRSSPIGRYFDGHDPFSSR